MNLRLYTVMPVPVTGIHVLPPAIRLRNGVDGRNKSGYDGEDVAAPRLHAERAISA